MECSACEGTFQTFTVAFSDKFDKFVSPESVLPSFHPLNKHVVPNFKVDYIMYSHADTRYNRYNDNMDNTTLLSLKEVKVNQKLCKNTLLDTARNICFDIS